MSVVSGKLNQDKRLIRVIARRRPSMRMQRVVGRAENCGSESVSEQETILPEAPVGTKGSLHET